MIKNMFALVAVMAAVTAVATAGTWPEQGDAPPLRPGQQTVGNGPLTSIAGSFVGGADVDLYKLNIVDYTHFSASTIGLTTADTRLYLFDVDGYGVTYNDDAGGTAQSTITSLFLTHNGLYYLAVTRYNIIATNAAGQYIWYPNPYNVEKVPDGPGAATPLGGWVGASFAADTTYGVALAGVRFGAALLQPGDLNCNGVVDFEDINPFVIAITSQASYQAAYPDCNWLNGDCNGDGYVDFDDINGFIVLLSGGDA
jgi:hypothetical protein